MEIELILYIVWMQFSLLYGHDSSCPIYMDAMNRPIYMDAMNRVRTNFTHKKFRRGFTPTEINQMNQIK